MAGCDVKTEINIRRQIIGISFESASDKYTPFVNININTLISS